MTLAWERERGQRCLNARATTFSPLAMFSLFLFFDIVYNEGNYEHPSYLHLSLSSLLLSSLSLSSLLLSSLSTRKRAMSKRLSSQLHFDREDSEDVQRPGQSP